MGHSMTQYIRRSTWLLIMALVVLLPAPHATQAGGVTGTLTPFQQQQQSIQELRRLTGAALEIGFINRAIPHHQSAIEMAMAVAAKAVHPEVRAIAQMVIMAQREEIAQLTDDLRTRYGRAVQPDPRFMMPPSEMAMLRQASPRMAEKMFMLMLREHHQSLNDMAQVVVQQGAPHVEFQDYALHMLSDQTEQQGQLYTLLRNLYGITPPTPTGDVARGMQLALASR